MAEGSGDKSSASMAVLIMAYIKRRCDMGGAQKSSREVAMAKRGRQACAHAGGKGVERAAANGAEG